MKMRKQRAMGVGMIVISALLLILASQGRTFEDRDATAVLLTLPLGLYMLFTRTYILYDGESPPERWEDRVPDADYTQRKELTYGEKTSDGGTEPQKLGGRERRPAADRRGADRAGRH